MSLLNPSVHIVAENIESVATSNAYLLVQAGESFLGFASFHPAEKKVNGWVIYQLDQDHSATALQEKLGAIAAAHPWVHSNYQKIILVQHAAKNILVPVSLNHEDGTESLFELLYEKKKNELHVKDFVLQQSLVNHYAVDGKIGRAHV